MSGNPHFLEAAKHRPQLVDEETANEHYTAEQGITNETMQFSALNRIAEATLAVAFEQRTANLIAMMDHARTDATKTARADVALERLGLIERNTK